MYLKDLHEREAEKGERRHILKEGKGVKYGNLKSLFSQYHEKSVRLFTRPIRSYDYE